MAQVVLMLAAMGLRAEAQEEANDRGGPSLRYRRAALSRESDLTRAFADAVGR